MEEARTLLLSEGGFSDLYLCYCGQSRCMPLHNYGPAVRPNYIIHYITEGKGCFYEGGNRYELEAGQGFLIVPGQQTFYQADKEEPWTYLWVGFDGRNAEHYLKEIGLTSEKPVYRCENGTILQEIVVIFRRASLPFLCSSLRAHRDAGSFQTGERKSLCEKSNGIYPKQLF